MIKIINSLMFYLARHFKYGYRIFVKLLPCKIPGSEQTSESQAPTLAHKFNIYMLEN